jgi:fumarate reductase (CoM/CoB) subunit B
MNQPRMVNVKIFRFDPEKDSSPHYEEYRLEIEGTAKVLELLDFVYQRHDPTLAYRSSCRSGKCGVCSVRVNGKPVLACRESVPEGTVLIEPLANYPVIRDLIVDRSPYDEKVRGLLTITAVHEQEQPLAVWKASDVEAYDKLSPCIECLLCDSKCPVLALSSKDYGGPALFRHDGFVESDKRVAQRERTLSERLGLNHCSTCKACAEVCPREIEVFDDAIRVLRRRRSFQESLSEMQKGYARVIRERGFLFTPYKVPLTEQLPEVVGPRENKGEVIFFPGCMMTMRFQGAGKAIVRILESLGLRVHLPREMICCGGPLLWTGQGASFEDVAARNIRVFEGVGVHNLVVGCAGCGMTLKKDYRRMAEELGLPKWETHDFVEVLERWKPLHEHRETRPLRVTYHDPCHLGRGQGIWGEPRRLLKSLPDVQFIELKDADRCCGGMLAAHSRDLSNVLSRQKAVTIIEANVDAVVTECPFCKDLISKALKKEDSPIVVYIVSELIEELYYRTPGSFPSG